MVAASTTPQRKRKQTQFPPRRGQIKAQMFDIMVKTVACAVSKAVEALGKTKGEGSSDGIHNKVTIITLKEMVTSLSKEPAISGGKKITIISSVPVLNSLID